LVCLLPAALAVWRFWPVYIAPGEGVWYQYRALGFYPADGLLAAAAVAGLVAWWSEGRRRSRPRPEVAALGGGLLLLAATAAASATFAGDTALALGMAGHLLLLMLFFVAVAYLSAGADRRWLVGGLAAVLAVEGTLAIAQTVTQSTAPVGGLLMGWEREVVAAERGASVLELAGGDRWLRAYGTFPHPNHLGGFVAVWLALLAIHDPRQGGWLRWTAAGLGLVALILSFSRTAWLAALAAGLVFGYFEIRGRRASQWWPVGLIGLTAVGLAVVGAVLPRGLGDDRTLERNSVQSRQYFEALAWRVYETEGPVGAGNLVLAQQPYGPAGQLIEPAHNALLITWVELGPPAPVAWLLLAAGVAIAGRRAWRVGTGRAGLAAAAALAPLLVLDHYLWTQPTGRTLVVLVLGMLAGAVVGRGDEGTMGQGEGETGGQGGVENDAEARPGYRDDRDGQAGSAGGARDAEVVGSGHAGD
jgi:hypothetical protein